MRFSDVVDLLVLAALWGASFIFMRIAAPELGPFVLGFLRAVIAALFLLPFLLVRAGTTELKTHWKKLAMVGILNSAIPFFLLAFATLSLSGGFASIINATAPLWAAVIAWIWLSEKLDGGRTAGLIIGFAGVVVLVWNKQGINLPGALLAILAAISAAFFYGLGANFTKKYMQGINTLVVAAGSMVGAAIVLLPGAMLYWPGDPVSIKAWVAISIMGIASTGIAYVLYFRLIVNVGPAKAITVTYLIPAFAVIWGAMFIDEKLTMNMVIGCAIILIGTALATGILSPGHRSAASEDDA
ncbi:MAG: EamA/RhaT family transporter [Gammaproteobacteria bacterium]|nr:MAG: EamA/RhaT family transporter [Gammaproteobacteria bacterium]RLA36966.1 MAG: EamA/RhaT family transporter [Gammaproteobacteria bacterium]